MILTRSPNARWITLHTYMWTAVIEKKFESDLRINEHYLDCSENKAWKNLNPWPLRYRCSALSTELTSHVGAGPQFIDMIFINLKLFIFPFTGLFGTNIMTSSQLAYTTVRLSAFNYHCLQLTRLVLRRSLQNNAYRYLTEVSIFTERQRYNSKHESIATLIEFDCPLNMESMVLVNAVWAPDEKNTSLELL